MHSAYRNMEPRPMIILNDDFNDMTNNEIVNNYFVQDRSNKIYRMLWPLQELNIIYEPYQMFAFRLQHSIHHIQSIDQLQAAWTDCLMTNNIVQEYSTQITVNVDRVIMAEIDQEDELDI